MPNRMKSQENKKQNRWERLSSIFISISKLLCAAVVISSAATISFYAAAAVESPEA